MTKRSIKSSSEAGALYFWFNRKVEITGGGVRRGDITEGIKGLSNERNGSRYLGKGDTRVVRPREKKAAGLFI